MFAKEVEGLPAPEDVVIGTRMSDIYGNEWITELIGQRNEHVVTWIGWHKIEKISAEDYRKTKKLSVIYLYLCIAFLIITLVGITLLSSHIISIFLLLGGVIGVIVFTWLGYSKHYKLKDSEVSEDVFP